jgi:VanZ family protein
MTSSLLELSFKLARIGAALSLAVTVAGTLTPAEDLPPGLPPDVMLHIVGFGVPTLLAAISSRRGRGFLRAVAIIALAAVASELAQVLIPGRTVSVLDLAANLVGMALGAALGWALQRLFLSLAVAPSGQS